jgi:hypothetical protein
MLTLDTVPVENTKVLEYTNEVIIEDPQLIELPEIVLAEIVLVPAPILPNTLNDPGTVVTLPELAAKTSLPDILYEYTGIFY